MVNSQSDLLDLSKAKLMLTVNIERTEFFYAGQYSFCEEHVSTHQTVQLYHEKNIWLKDAKIATHYCDIMLPFNCEQAEETLG